MKDLNKELVSIVMSRMGRMGSDARNKKLSPERRKEIATKASRARWNKNK